MLPNLPKKSGIVMDRATYHMDSSERVLPAQMRKAAIQQWLVDHEIPWEEHWLKPALVETMEQHIDRTPLVQKEARQHGHQLLLLPVQHRELNPIELVWAIVKNECAKKLRFKDVLAHLHEALENISELDCQNIYQHVSKQEQDFWKIDLEFDDMEIEENELEEIE